MDTSLIKKIGQMIVAGFPSPTPDEQVRRLVKDYRVGNFVLFTRNLLSPEQAGELCNSLNSLAFNINGGFAPFIGIDQEGGPVSRIYAGASLFPGAMAIAASGMDVSYEIGLHCGRLLRAMGINSNFAPVLDVNISPLNPIIGSRAFSDDPHVVAKLGIDMLKGFKDANVLSLVKHFPGHGNVVSDSHLGIPINNTPCSVLERTEWMPFQKAFDMGADALMTAHVCYTDADDKNPATLSQKVMHDLLRIRMGFSGLVFTDCLEMDAIKRCIGLRKGAVMAIEAGCDLLTFSHTLEAVDEAVHGVYDAVKCSRIPEARLDESLARIAAIKKKYGLIGEQHIDKEYITKLCADKHAQKLYSEVSSASVTLLSKRGKGPGVFWLGKKAFFSPESLALTGAEDKKHNRLCFSLICAQHFGGIGGVTPINGIDEITENMLASNFDVAVLGLYNARFRPGQVELLRRLEASGKPLIVILLGAPYDAALVQRANAVIAAYEYTPLSVSAVIESLKTGRFPGRSPVKLQTG